MNNIFKSLYRGYVNCRNDAFIDNRYIGELNAMKGKDYQVRELPENFKKEYMDYYASFGFKNVPLDWVEYIYSIKGDLDVGYIPDPLYHKFIDPYFPYAKYEVADKYLQPFVLGDIVAYPETIVANVGGTYFDADSNVLNPNDVLQQLKHHDEFIVKPTVYNGAGMNVRLLKNSDDIESLFNDCYKKDFIVQKRLLQHSVMAELNESSVNTVRILTMIRNGEVYILSSFVRVGHSGSIIDNLSGHPDNYRVAIHEDGHLDSVGYNSCSESINRTQKEKPFSDFMIPKYKEMVEIAKKGHHRFAKHKIIGWDFTVDKEGQVVLIEYNFKLFPIIDYEISSGPLFCNQLDDILKEAAEYRALRNKIGVHLISI